LWWLVLEAFMGDDAVRERLARHVLTDGFHLILDLRRSRGSWITDARAGEQYLDLYSFFASAPLGINPPDITSDQDFLNLLAEAAANKPTNSDIYTGHYADFVDTFVRVLGDPALPHLFFIEGGALAVENALKCAFDWKSRHNEMPRVPRTQRVHALAHQHRPGEDRPLPQVRLAPHRGARDHLPPSRTPRRGDRQ
jgi:4-aminobutyrate aminotransferase-like enzyme